MSTKALSVGEETFALHCRAYQLTPEREHRFHPMRKWCFDFAWPNEKLAVEVEGLTRDGGRHQRRSGYEKDCEKYNAAALLGWRVLRYSTAMVTSGKAINQVLSAMKGKG